METSTRKIVKSSLWVTAGFVLIRASQLVTQIILARLLSPSDFGIWAMILLVTSLSSQFKDLAIAGVLVYRGLGDRKLTNAVYSLGVNISIGMGILQALSGFALSEFFQVPVLLPLTICVSLVFLIGAGAGSHGAVMQRQMKFKELAFCETIAAIARLAGALICAALGAGIWSFVTAELAMATVDSILKRRLSGYRFTYQLVPDTSAIREVQSYISGIIGCNLAVYFNTNCDNLIIGKLLGSQALGYYNFAYQLAMVPVFALSQINRVNFSVLTQQDSQGKKIYIHRMLNAYGLVSAPVYGLAFLVAPWLFPAVFGTRWLGAVHLFQIILIFAYARGFMSIMGAILDSLNKPATNAAIGWAIIPLSVTSYLIGAALGGTTGVAIAVAIVMGFVATLWFLIMVCRIAKYNILFLARPILLPLAMIALSMVIATHVPMSAYLQIYLQPLILVISYASILSVCLPRDVFQITSSIRELLPARGRA